MLDECHHATGKHAVNQLLRHYHASQERTQVGSCFILTAVFQC